MATTPIPSTQFGKVVGRFVLAFGDSRSDDDNLPDVSAAVGQIVFTPVTPRVRVATSPLTMALPQQVTTTLDSQGYIRDPAGATGVWLPEGVYNVSYLIEGAYIPEHQIQVNAAKHTASNPMDLVLQAPLPDDPSVVWVVNEQLLLDAQAAHAAAVSARDAAAAARDSSVAARNDALTAEATARQISNSLPTRVADIVAADATFYDAAEAAVQTALTGSSLITATRAASTDLEIVDDNLVPVATIKDLRGRPYLAGSTPVDAIRTADAGVEWVDIHGVPIDMGGDGTGGGTGFSETHLIAAIGNSNTFGALATPGAPEGTMDPLSNLYMVPQSGGSVGTLLPLTEPLAHPKGNAGSNTRGFVGAFARWYALQHPDVRVVVVPTAVSGSGLRHSVPDGNYWAPAMEGQAGVTSLYREAITRIKAAASLFNGTVKTPIIAGFMMGADSILGATPSTYLADLKALTQGLRTELPGATDAVALFGQSSWEYLNVRKEGTTTELNAALLTFPSTLARTAIARNTDAPGYTNSDNTHLTGRGQWLMVENFIQAYKDALYNL